MALQPHITPLRGEITPLVVRRPSLPAEQDGLTPQGGAITPLMAKRSSLPVGQCRLTLQDGDITPSTGQRLSLPAMQSLESPVAALTTAQHVTARPSLGPLAERAQQWRACVTSNWVLRTVTLGYRLQFVSTPPRFNKVLQSRAQGDGACILREEINSLLHKGAVWIVPSEEKQNGFYSSYFLVPEKDRGTRPILDLRMGRYL